MKDMHGLSCCNTPQGSAQSVQHICRAPCKAGGRPCPTQIKMWHCARQWRTCPHAPRVVSGGQRLELQARVQGTAHGGRASALASAAPPVSVEVVYEDDHLAVVVKPPGMPVQVLFIPRTASAVLLPHPQGGFWKAVQGPGGKQALQQCPPALEHAYAGSFLQPCAATASCNTSLGR